MLNITLFAALPEEYRLFKSRTGRWRRVCRKPFNKWCCSYAGKELVLVDTGMGEERINEALNWAARDELPDIIISFGFAGSLSEDFPVGLVALGSDFVRWQQRADSADRYDRVLCEFADGTLSRFCRAQDISLAQVLTLDRPRPKSLMKQKWAGVPAVMDMESYFVAAFCGRMRVPFFCFRAVSDGALDEIEYDLNDITHEGRVRPAKVMDLIARRPYLLPAFYASWKRSRWAARQLAKAMAAFLAVPNSELSEMVRESRSERLHQTGCADGP